MGFIDRTAKQGETYDYYIQPTVWDNGGKVIFEPGVREKLLVKPHLGNSVREISCVRNRLRKFTCAGETDCAAGNLAAYSWYCDDVTMGKSLFFIIT